MQILAMNLILAVIVGLVSGDLNDRFPLDAIEGIKEETKEQIAKRLENMTDAIEHKWDIVHELMDEDETQTETVAEFEGVDEKGCDRKLRKHYDDRCEEVYEKVNDEAQEIENEKERTEAVCCALEDYEKCSLRAFDQAGCVTDKEAIRENMKAARLFLTVISGITCSEFRGQCAVYLSAATSSGYAGYVLLLSVLGQVLIKRL